MNKLEKNEDTKIVSLRMSESLLTKVKKESELENPPVTPSEFIRTVLKSRFETQLDDGR